MRVLSLVNEKGGCGKTTTAVHLAGALAERGERVLLVDLDPQAHATLSLGCTVDREASTLDVILHGVPVARAARRVGGGFDLLPSTARLSEFEEVAARSITPEQRLSNELGRAASLYDYALVDCPPRTGGVLTANALRASTTALLTVETGTYALQGARKAIRILTEIAGELDDPFRIRTVATLFDQDSRLAREILLGMFMQFGERLLNTVVRSSERLREAAASGVPIQVFDPSCAAALDFRELAWELAALEGTKEPTAPARRRRRTATPPESLPLTR